MAARGGAINLVDGLVYPHHPVMQAVRIEPYTLEKDYLVELNGLKVPAKYDCAVERGDAPGSGRHWGLFWYFNDVATRWHACWLHHAAVKSGLRTEIPELPIVDDEYMEQCVASSRPLTSGWLP